VDKHEDEKRGNNAEPFGLIQKDRGAYGVGYLFVICGFSLAEPENREGDLSWVEPLKARGPTAPRTSDEALQVPPLLRDYGASFDTFLTSAVWRPLFYIDRSEFWVCGPPQMHPNISSRTAICGRLTNEQPDLSTKTAQDNHPSGRILH